jgi:PAS domain-containing protein
VESLSKHGSQCYFPEANNISHLQRFYLAKVKPDNYFFKALKLAEMNLGKQYAITIEKLTDVIYACNAEGYICVYNKAASNLWGWQPIPEKEKYCGSSKIMDADGNNLDTAKYPIALLLNEDKPADGVELIIQRFDGDICYVIQYSFAVYSIDGSLSGAITRQIDITEKRQKELWINQALNKCLLTTNSKPLTYCVV